MDCRLSNITVHYTVHGEGRPIVMIHGYSPDHRLMVGCMEPIFKERSGWKRIYIDLPGMGATKGEEWIKNSDDMLDIVSQFIHRVIPGQHFLIAGESYGGYLARGLVHKHPELIDGMLLICPMVIADKTQRELPEHKVIVKDNNILSTLSRDEAEEFAAMAVVQSQRNWERFRDEVLSGAMAADHAFLTRFKNIGYAFTFNVDTLSGPFNKPVLIMTGRQDASVGYRDAWRILENYPRGTFAVLDKAGHNLQIEQDLIFNALVKEWMERVEEE